MQIHKNSSSTARHSLTSRHHAAVHACPVTQARPCRLHTSRTRSVECRAALDPETVTNATYATLGLTALSFVGTFFVAPKFKDSFKEDVDWRDIYKYLAASGVKQVDAAEAYAKSKR